METPRSRIKGMLRQIFLRSRERAEALKRDGYKCQKCGVKQSTKKGFEQKVQVHHKAGIDIWDDIIWQIEDKILCKGHLEDLQTLCPNCHAGETYGAV